MVNRLVSGISSGQGTIGKLLTDDQLYSNLQQFVDAANEMARSVRAGRGTIGKLLNDPRSSFFSMPLVMKKFTWKIVFSEALRPFRSTLIASSFMA